MFCLRRLLLVTILVVFRDYKVMTKLIIMSVVQAPYFIIVLSLRPFEFKKDNFLEVFDYTHF